MERYIRRGLPQTWIVIMNSINERQKLNSNVEIAASFRLAYEKAKHWKGVVWVLATLLSTFQLIIANQLLRLPNEYMQYLPATLIAITLLSILMSTLGNHFFIKRYISLGSLLQRLHDFNILELGTKPSYSEIRPSLINEYSKIWLKKKPNDKDNLIEWWPASVSDVPKSLGISIALLSTFKWEAELRAKYRLVVLFFVTILILASFSLMYCKEYKIDEYISLILLPLSPLLALLINEYLDNGSGLEIAKSAEKKADIVMINCFKQNSDKDNNLEQLAFNWNHYRSSSSPIFDWLYWITQHTMNRDMIIDSNSLVDEYLKKINDIEQ